MSDLPLLLVMPIVLCAILVWLRARRAAAWWLGLVGYSAAVVVFAVARGGEWRIMVGGILIYVLPVLLMFLGLRPTVFLRRRWLIPPVGLMLYLVGLAVSLSINVSAGLIQP